MEEKRRMVPSWLLVLIALLVIGGIFYLAAERFDPWVPPDGIVLPNQAP